MPPLGTTATRIEVLERAVEYLQRECAALRQSRLPSIRPTLHGFWAKTCKGKGEETYPTEGSNPNTYFVKIVEAAFSPRDNDGVTSQTITERSSEGLFVARQSGTAYVPEGTLVRIEPSKVRGGRPQWWIVAGGTGGGTQLARGVFAVGPTALTRSLDKIVDAICIWAEGAEAPEPESDDNTLWQLESNVTGQYWFAAETGQHVYAERLGTGDGAKWRILHPEPVLQSVVTDSVWSTDKLQKKQRTLWVHFKETESTTDVVEGETKDCPED